MNCKGFIEFPKTDVVHLQVKAFKQFWYCEYWPDTHFIGLGTGNSHADIATQWVEPGFLCRLCFHYNAGRRAIGKLRRVTRCNDIPGPKHRFQSLQTFKRGRRAVAFILADRDIDMGNFFGFLVLNTHGRRHFHDLRIKMTSLLSGCRAHLRLQRIFVAGFTANPVTFAHHLGGLQHRHINIFVHLEQFTVRLHPHFRCLNGRDRLLSASDNHIHPVKRHLLGRSGNCHQAGGTLPVDRHARHFDRKA